MAEQNRPLKEARAFREKSMAGRLVILGTNFIAGIVVLGYAGHLLDKKLGREYLFMVTGSCLGIAWAMYEAIKTAILLSKEEEKPKDKEKQPGEP